MSYIIFNILSNIHLLILVGRFQQLIFQQFNLSIGWCFKQRNHLLGFCSGTVQIKIIQQKRRRSKEWNDVKGNEKEEESQFSPSPQWTWAVSWPCPRLAWSLADRAQLHSGSVAQRLTQPPGTIRLDGPAGKGMTLPLTSGAAPMAAITVTVAVLGCMHLSPGWFR